MKTLVVAAGLLLVSCAAIPAPTPSPTAAAEATVVAVAMSVPRAAHTATKLADGRVLVTGGFGLGDRIESSMELFAPTTATFAAAGVMDAPRHSHSATLLTDGRVLIAGGYTSGAERLATAVLYDPARGAITPTGPLLAPRADHTAVLLADGRVLVAGGTGPGTTFLASAEVYDPALGTFSAVGSMRDAREANTLTLLADGRVLVAGGHRERSPNTVVLAGAELFDPRIASFAPTGPMGVRRAKHDAVRLEDGSVLILGGADERDDRGAYASAERFDPRSGTFSPTAALAQARYKIRGMTVLLPGGRVLVAGGAARPELYSLTTGSRTIGASFGRAPMIGTATLLDDGRVMLAGGYSLTGPASRDAFVLTVP